MTPIEFSIPYAAVPKQSFRYAGKGRRGFTSTRVSSNAELLILASMPYRPIEPITGPVMVDYTFSFAYRQQDKLARKSGLVIPHFSRPDLGNLVKQMDDVLEAAGFFADDGQICEHAARKVRGPADGVRVVVRTV